MKRRSFLLAFALALAAAGVGAESGNAAGDLVVIVNKACKLDDVSSADLAKYFRSDKTKAPDGTKLVIVMHETGRPEREAALRGIYRMTENEYTEHFVEATFTGAVATAPKALPSGAAVRKFVAETPGALGYVRVSDLDDSVKALKIDGHAPGTADYKLKLK